MIYCRRCDLAFCDEHLHVHNGDDTHELAENEAATFCGVCVGLYSPTPTPPPAD